MHKINYLVSAVAACLSISSTAVFAEILSAPEQPENLTSSANSPEDHQAAAKVHRSHMKYHKGMANHHKSLAAEYGHSGKTELKKHHEIMASHHEALSQEHENTAKMHELMDCMSETNSLCNDSPDSKKICCAKYVADRNKINE